MRTDNNIKSDRLNVEVRSYCQGFIGKMLCWLTKKFHHSSSIFLRTLPQYI